MKRYFRYLVYTLLALVLLAAAVYASGYLASLRKTVDTAELPGLAAWFPEGKLPLGADGKAVLQFTLPLWCRIAKHTVTPGTGLVQSGPVQFQYRWRWNKRIWLVTVPFRAYRTGTIPPGKLELLFAARKSKELPVRFETTIPDCTVTDSDIPQGDDLALAGEVAPAPRKLSRHWLWLLLLIPVVYLLGRFLRREKPQLPPPPWVTAKLALEALKWSIQKGETPPETAYFQLTDLVRNYLEVRLHIPASTRTTPEFLSEMEGSGETPSPLPEEYRPFLREFLSAADLVKFAKMEPDRTMLNEAITRAEELVDKTGAEAQQEEVQHV